MGTVIMVWCFCLCCGCHSFLSAALIMSVPALPVLFTPQSALCVASLYKNTALPLLAVLLYIQYSLSQIFELYTYSYLLICSILKLHIFSLLMFRLHLSFLFLLYLLQLFLHCELHTVKHRKGELKGPPFLLLMVLLNLLAHSFSLIYFLNM